MNERLILGDEFRLNHTTQSNITIKFIQQNFMTKIPILL